MARTWPRSRPAAATTSRPTPPASRPTPTSTTSRCSTATATAQMSDVLAGIDWVIYHAKEYNIRVMNLSLAADSTESWQTDPLARAARSAAAAGITVVVAAGNFGQNASGAATLRHDQLARARPDGDHGRLGQHQGHARCAATTRSTSSARAARRAARTSTRLACARSTTCSSPTWSRRATRSSGALSRQTPGATATTWQRPTRSCAAVAGATQSSGQPGDVPQRHLGRRARWSRAPWR